MKMRIIGLDVGTKTIGIAVSDELSLTAQGVTTLKRKVIQQDIKKLLKVIEDHEAEKVVVGLPKNMNGSLGPSARMVIALIEELKKQCFLDSYKITSLSAFAKNDIWFDLNGIEIRIGSGDYAEKLSRLKGLIIPRLKDDLDKIEYIDLRFAEYTFKIKH